MKDIEKVAKDYVVRERSDYQLKHFVIGQHDTPEMQYRQILLEVKSLVMKIKLAELDVEKKRIKISRLTDDPLDIIKAKKLELGISITLDALEGARRELDFLLRLAENYQKYSPQDIEDNQEQYWQARLERQAAIDQMGSQQQISPSNLMSMLNAGLLKRGIEQ
jgi:hypothetical protein